ncbi:MAG TPA: cyclic nucleotide-binding domain-containing protein, partial [Polyangiaceae bacterium]|nr:cyclic nucleotide-binding domain-containing protein [Polyangiaceae bacterium]
MSAAKKKDVHVRELRRRGLEFVTQNQFHRAAQIYLELMDLEPEEGDWPRRAADCFWQLKDAAARLKYSVRAAEIYCDGGFLLKAVAMCKVVLNLDPSHQETQQRLALLYAKRPETTRNHLPASLADSAATISTQTQGSDQSQEARRSRARLAAALALRRIRAQRKAHQEEPQSATGVESVVHTDALQPSVPEPSEPAPPADQPARAPSLHAISLHAHLPSEKRSLVPTSPSTAYSISLSQLPPADVMVLPPLPTFSGMSSALPLGMEGLDPTWPKASAPPATPPGSRSARDGLPAPEILFAPAHPPKTANRPATPAPERPLPSPRGAGLRDPAAHNRPAAYIRPAALFGTVTETSATRTLPDTIVPPTPDPSGPVLELDLPEEDESSSLELAPFSLAPSTAQPDAETTCDAEPDAEATDIELDDQPSAFDTLFSQFENLPLFGSLGHDSMVTLINGMDLVELSDGQVLFEEGDLADSMYVVTEGTLLAEVDRTASTPLVVAELVEGQFFGEIGLLSDQPRQARVRAQGVCRLLRIERHVVAELMAKDSTFLATLLEFLRDRLVTYVAQTSPLFATLPTEEGLELARSFEFLEVDDDTALLEPGLHPTGLYVLLAGSAFCYRPKSRQQFTQLGPGAMFGEGPLLSRTASDMEVRTTSKCFALFLGAARFRELIMTHPTVLAYVSSLDGESDRMEWSDH